MADQLSAKDWLDQGLKVLAERGFTALKAEPLAKAMGVSRGSFYWHFADIGAFHAAILKHWREVAAERIIAGLEAAADHESPLERLLRRTFSSKLTLEKAVRSWATVDPLALSAVEAIDRRRLDGCARKHLGLAEHAVDQRDRDRGHTRTLQQEIAHRLLSIQNCMVIRTDAGGCQYSSVW